MEYVNSLLDLVGNTPLLRLGSTTDGAKPTVLAKIEYLNPGGSVKDRIALRMVEAAEDSGELKPGGTIVEPTSGNTGVGLAMVAQAKGYSLHLRVPGQGERGQAQRAQGVRRRGGRLPDRRRTGAPGLLLQRLRPADARDAERLEARPVLQPEQPTAATTRPPVRRSGGRPTARSRTSSAASARAARSPASGRYLKEVSDGRVQIIGADPEGSVYSGGSGRPYLVEGVGEDFWPEAYDRDIADRIIAVSDRDSFMLRAQARPRGGTAGRWLVGDGGGGRGAARARARRP